MSRWESEEWAKDVSRRKSKGKASGQSSLCRPRRSWHLSTDISFGDVGYTGHNPDQGVFDVSLWHEFDIGPIKAPTLHGAWTFDHPLLSVSHGRTITQPEKGDVFLSLERRRC